MKNSIQISLRSALILVAVFGIWFARQAHRERQRLELVQTIELAGGSVSTSDSFVYLFFRTEAVSTVAIPYWSLDEFSDEELAIFDNLTEIVVLEFQCTFSPSTSSTQAKAMTHLYGMTSKRLSVAPDAKELLRKIRDRQTPISFEEIMSAHPEMRCTSNI